MKYLLQAVCKRLGVAVARASNARDLIDFIHDREIDVVIDVGANIGQFGESLRNKGYRGRIVSFEPIESAYRTLSRRTAADGNWEAHHCGLGAASGEAIINVSRLSVFSSILTLTNVAIQLDTQKQTAVERTETIHLRTLDEVAVDLFGKILLKIDTQGYEKHVIEGGKQTITRLKGILIELPIIHLYEGNWYFHEAMKFMDEAGFVPAQFHPVNYRPKDKVSLHEVDCLFRPRGELDIMR